MDPDDLPTGTRPTETDGVADGLLELCVDVPVRIVVRELGATTGVEAWLGEHNLFAVWAGTRHVDTAAATGVELLANAFRAALAPALDGERTYDPATIHDDRNPLDI